MHIGCCHRDTRSVGELTRLTRWRGVGIDGMVEPSMAAARWVDLHLHTTWSDGRWEPQRVVTEAAERGLAAIAVTDHDVLGGIAEAEAAAEAAGIELIAGIELTANWDGRTIHVLGYDIDVGNERLLGSLERGRRLMADHVERVRAALDEAGEPIDRRDLEGYRTRYAGGASLVLAMVERGVLRRAKNGRELLRLASDEPRAYTAGEAIDLIHGAGGVAVLAHPARIRPVGVGADTGASTAVARDGKGQAPTLHEATDLAPLVDAGLDGIEVWNIVHGQRERQHYAQVAEELGLLVSGGSDCHGPRRGLGPRLGSQQVPYAVLERIRRTVDARRERNAGERR
jgi:predicted metal-dependent phosphoesterase TrpH